jgi:hypothetical protein
MVLYCYVLINEVKMPQAIALHHQEQIEKVKLFI